MDLANCNFSQHNFNTDLQLIGAESS